jgi:hypothetical protein
MTPPDSSLSVMEVLIWAGFVIRDLAAIWTVAMAGITLLLVVIRSLARTRSRLPGNILESGILAWGFTLLGCLAPLDRGLLFGRSQAVNALVVSGAVWILAFIISSLGKSRDR